MASLTTLILAIMLVVLQFGPSAIEARNRASPGRPVHRNSTWTGWKDVKYMFSFGNSYTSTVFDPRGIQPSIVNPIGNPPFPGSTSCNGPNYIGFLTATYNQSFIETYNLAVGGATLDADIVKPFLPILDIRGQIDLNWFPVYSNRSLVPWTASNSLFSIFVGVNDITNSYQLDNSTILPALMAEYSALLDQLYQAGARNFLLLNCPPIDKSPGTILQGPAYQKPEAADIADYNSRLDIIASNLTSSSSDVTVFVFDTNGCYSKILSNPGVFPQTAGIKNTTSYCQAYANGTPNTTSFDPSCYIPVNEYFWLNNLHPVWPVHDAMAAEIVKILG